MYQSIPVFCLANEFFHILVLASFLVSLQGGSLAQNTDFQFYELLCATCTKLHYNEFKSEIA